MPMPEASMHLDHLLERGKNQIGSAWQVTSVQLIAVTEPMHRAPHGQLWLRIGVANPCHAASDHRLYVSERHVSQMKNCTVRARAVARVDAIVSPAQAWSNVDKTYP